MRDHGDTISPQELARALEGALPERTITEMARDGRLPGERRGRRWLLPRDQAIDQARQIVAARSILAGREPVKARASGEVWLWDVGTGKQKAVLKGHIFRVTSVAFSPDDNLVRAAVRGHQPEPGRGIGDRSLGLATVEIKLGPGLVSLYQVRLPLEGYCVIHQRLLRCLAETLDLAPMVVAPGIPRVQTDGGRRPSNRTAATQA